ncbi:odorant receptor 131-2-like isoform X2 [Brienomyrus brachyistius]|uniref:odorant receptor 131-2-like isoform X2 n=1 Tax=Brienomyrus brachyistius TaxID=42636 RepID=UPI0020B39288|nr:odorant receptor 131-2-like isoform X2 [Brienomyrus brachyistius]
MAGQNGSSLELSFLYYQSITGTIDFMTTIKSFLVLSTALFFISLNLIMFVAMWSKPSFRETSRYLLFSQMLLSDSIHLGFTTLLYSCSMANINLIKERLFLAKWQFDVFQSFNGVFFVAVGITVIGTYTGIMMAAQSIKAKKASRTVLLHLVQLVLCLSSFLFSSIERALSTISSALFIHLRTLNFFLLVLLPRCLSPLIYGLRDEGVRPLFLRYLRCGRWRIKPRTSTR